ncbi:MAG TPA: YkgJ family cysteine cluster protein [Candidatus Polarisedimenticolaceae bacterium]|nr:YkgJ family cysteine cluster protein [Candidatus Polarisedimenticolaceae bacterium]
MAKRPPWYAEGLRFACQPDCGRCCSNHDDYAYVYLSEEDAAALAAHLNLDQATFRARWTQVDDGDLVLHMGQDACPFLDGARCTVYEARPTQCRTFPFWKENLKRRGDWEKLKTFCPGIGQGQVHSLLQISERAAEREAK